MLESRCDLPFAAKALQPARGGSGHGDFESQVASGRALANVHDDSQAAPTKLPDELEAREELGSGEPAGERTGLLRTLHGGLADHRLAVSILVTELDRLVLGFRRARMHSRSLRGRGNPALRQKGDPELSFDPMSGTERELRWLRRVRDFSHQLASEEKLSRLLPRILDAAIEITEAERGFLVRVLGRTAKGAPRLNVEVARGFDQAALKSDSASVSRTVVERVLARGGAGSFRRAKRS